MYEFKSIHYVNLLWLCSILMAPVVCGFNPWHNTLFILANTWKLSRFVAPSKAPMMRGGKLSQTNNETPVPLLEGPADKSSRPGRLQRIDGYTTLWTMPKWLWVLYLQTPPFKDHGNVFIFNALSQRVFHCQLFDIGTQKLLLLLWVFYFLTNQGNQKLNVYCWVRLDWQCLVIIHVIRLKTLQYILSQILQTRWPAFVIQTLENPWVFHGFPVVDI